VSEAAVVVRHDDDGRPLSLVAFVALQAGVREILPRHIQAMVAQRLPRYAVPAQVHLVEALPRLQNYKVDRAGLAALDAAHLAAQRNRSDDGVEAEIIGIFEAVTGVKGATPEDTVASLGGDSLQEVTLIDELERRYGVAISSAAAMHAPSINQVVDWLAARNGRGTPGHAR
jgi:acyl carrier protein